MTWLIAFFRRYFGGYDSKFNFLENRGVQCVFLITVVFVWEFFVYQKNYIISFLIGLFVYIFFSVGHWYYYKCGTEDDAYIDEQLAKGRKPCLNWLVKPINKLFGFEERSKQYCFVGLFIRYTLYSIPVSCFIGFHFTGCAMAIPFVYNAMFWVNLPQNKFCGSPTNWAEWFAGLIIGYGLY